MLTGKRVLLEKQRGFTLFEVIVTLVIMGIIAGVVIGVVALNARSLNLISNTTLARYDLRQAMKTLRDDIQQIRPADIVYNGGALTADQLLFDDLDGNRISYIFSGGNLTRNGTSILSNVQQNPFTYLDINLNTTSTNTDVRYIDVDLQVTYNTRTVELGDRFYVRN